GCSQVQHRRHGHHDDLEDPEADVGERGEGVVADVLAARLLRVADELALFIIVDGLAPHGRQHNAEDDEDGQPDLAHEGRVVVDLLQEPRQETPAHPGWAVVSNPAGKAGKQALSKRVRCTRFPQNTSHHPSSVLSRHWCHPHIHKHSLAQAAIESQNGLGWKGL
uniref:Uncharacterized protein n=1 Tax=Amazona collaria TaxID=241587 RepID=A0A8B9FAD7_9PSIT